MAKYLKMGCWKEKWPDRVFFPLTIFVLPQKDDGRWGALKAKLWRHVAHVDPKFPDLSRAPIASGNRISLGAEIHGTRTLRAREASKEWHIL